MAGIANIRRWNMVGTFATGHGAVMTIKARTHNLCMVDRDGRDWCPGCREFLVTSIAYVTRGNMRCTLATGCYPIVASNAVTDKRGVIHCKCRYPGIGSMTIITFQCRLNMIRLLTDCQCAIVTG